jgi:hypothetical protein
MKRTLLLVAVILLTQSPAFSQADELKKFEVAAEFSSLKRESFDGREDAGFGGRFTFNLNRVVSLEAAGYFFPHNCFSCRNNGRVTEVVGGVKVGKRFERWGIFAKARPGVVSFSDGAFDVKAAPTPTGFPFEITTSRLNAFATDVGGVLEFYPSKRIVTRFDAGDTIIRFGRRTTNAVLFDQPGGGFTLFPITTPARTANNFQFMASVGWRF